MDSLSQIVLGASVAAACTPARHRRAALLVGAALGTLPDLDVLPLSLFDLDPVQQMTLHRGASHSLLVLPVVGLVIWAALRRWAPVREAPQAWLWAILLALITHPLLDAFTVYGTQLLWPFMPHPAMWSSMFIIDPLYTLPLLLGCVLGWRWRERVAGTRAVLAGLALSTAYLGLSMGAKMMVEREVDAALAGTGHEQAPRFSVPMPFQIALWRVVVMTPDGYLEGERSLIADRGPMRLRSYRSDVAALAEAAELPAVRQLAWFNRGFMKAERVDGRLVLSDLRMGVEGAYFFRFAVAEEGEGGWQEIRPEQLRTPRDVRARLPGLWERIWSESP